MSSEQQEPKGPRVALREAALGVREFFSLRNARARSAALSPDARDAARLLQDAALERLAGADQLWVMGKATPALELYRAATVLFLRALLRAQSPEDAATTAAPLALLDAVAARLQSAEAPALACLRSLLATETLALDHLGALENRRSLRAFSRATHWLSEQLELRTLGAIRLHRIQRAAVAVAVAAALLWGGAKLAFPPTNWALHRPVTASGYAFDTKPEGAVDGIRYGQLGFHSAQASSPWLVVDLGKPIALEKVRVLGRPECCYDQSIPLALEGSKDGVKFSEIAQRTEPFTQYEPWEVDARGNEARFVRLKTLRRSYLVVGELEVYGKPL